MSPARIWYERGKRAESRNLLLPIYDWFTEGFDTPDLIEAKALIEPTRLSYFHAPASGFIAVHKLTFGH
jgi:hypothetical protein